LVADILDLPFAELAALNPASLHGMIPAEFPPFPRAAAIPWWRRCN
jgi:hypothetical protein